MSDLKAMDLFEAYAQKKLPMDRGFIVSSFFKEESAYSVYEIISYATVKDIYKSGGALTFHTSGKKLFLLVEPANFTHKTTEPVFRSKEFQVPLRFKESNIVTAKNQYKIMYSKTPQEAISAFTVLKPEGINFAFLFYSLPDVFNSVELFFEKTLNQEANVPLSDSKEIAQDFAKLCSETLIWSNDA